MKKSSISAWKEAHLQCALSRVTVSKQYVCVIEGLAPLPK